MKLDSLPRQARDKTQLKLAASGVFRFGCAGAAIADAAGDAQAVVTCGETEFPTPPTSPTLRQTAAVRKLLVFKALICI